MKKILFWKRKKQMKNSKYEKYEKYHWDIHNLLSLIMEEKFDNIQKQLK